MTRRLIAYVHVNGVAYGPDDDVPAEVAKRIGDHAWADVDKPSGAPTPTGEDAPPRSGRGSGIDAWLAFAEQHGVGTDSDMSRDDVIAACEAAGVVEREE